MPQNNYIEQHLKKVGKRPDSANLTRKKEARKIVKKSKLAKTTRGIKAKMLNKKNFTEKIKMKKTIKAHEEKKVDVKVDDVKDGSKPAYLLDREEVNRSKILSNTIKQKRKEKAGRWSVPIERVKALTEAEMFQVKKSGKRQKKAWKRVINKLTFVPENFVRKPPKYEKFIRTEINILKKRANEGESVGLMYGLPTVRKDGKKIKGTLAYADHQDYHVVSHSI